MTEEQKMFAEEIAASVKSDFERRCADRRQYEAQWQLNTNFVLGNQYCYVNLKGEVEDSEKDYYWQEREVYNHIASIAETRLAKLSRVRPKMGVRPSSGDDFDVKTAKVASKILDSAYSKLKIDEILGKGTMWSELTGTAFYKISWDSLSGKKVGYDGSLPVFEGEVRIDVCPPYEIYPDSLSNQGIAECRSIIHAKAVHTDDIKRLWGKDVKAEDTEVVDISGSGLYGSMGLVSAVPALNRSVKRGHALVLEKYSLPSADHPDGELIIVSGGQLLYYGPLPFINGEDGKRELPFVRQCAIEQAGAFFGVSMVERAIPIQRAYNAVKNRKHEFLNRIAMGVLAIEDGSVDTGNLEDEGLSPGKILVYRQGSQPPRFLSPGSVPSDFTVEEQRLLSEFIDISGISEIMRSSSVPSTVTSGVAIQMLVEQDDTRISVTAENIRQAAKAMAKSMLRLYKQFAGQPRLSRFVGEGGEIELISWNKSDIGCDDVVFETNNEISNTAATRQNVILDLLKTGLLYDEDGKLSDVMRYKILDAFGYGGWEQTQDLNSLHIGRAASENVEAPKTKPEVKEIDDHDLHIAEHIKYMLSADFKEKSAKYPAAEKILTQHIREHKAFKRATAASEEA